MTPTKGSLGRLALAIVLALALPEGAIAQQKRAPRKRPAQKAAPQRPALSKPAEADPIEQHYRAAETFQVAQDFARAEGEYRKVIGLALQRLAGIQVAAGKEKDALGLLERAVEADPAHLGAKVDLAIGYFRAGNLEAAKKAGEAVIAVDKNDRRARALLGSLYFTEGSYQKAAEHFREAMAQSADLEMAYSLALTHLKLKEPDKAAILFDEMLVSGKPSPELYVLIGRAYRETGYYEQAETALTKALQSNPRAPRANAYLGLTYLLARGAQGEEQARKHFRAELALNPEDYLSHYSLGVMALEKKRYAEAIAHLERAAKARRTSFAAWLNLGEAYLGSGDSKAAGSTLGFALAKVDGAAPQHMARAHRLMSEAMRAQGNTAAAEGHAAEAKKLEAAGAPAEVSVATLMAAETTEESRPNAMIAATPAGAAPAGAPGAQAARPAARETEAYLAGVRDVLGNAYHNLGVIHAQRKQYKEAAQLFSEAAKWTKSIPALDRNLGAASFRAEQYAQAVEPLQRHLGRVPDDRSAREMLVLSAFMSENMVRAAEAFRPLLGNMPSNPGVLYAAGTALARLGDARTAAAVFERMLAANPRNPEVRLLLGQAYAAQEDNDGALREFARALELNPRQPQAHYYGGMVHLRAGRMQEAEQAFRRELEVSPQDLAAKYHLGVVLVSQKKFEEAVPVLREVVERSPGNGDAHYQLGRALLERGEVRPAVQQLEIAARLEPNRDYVFYQLGLAYRRDGQGQQAEAAMQQYQKLRDTRRGQSAGERRD